MAHFDVYGPGGAFMCRISKAFSFEDSATGVVEAEMSLDPSYPVGTWSVNLILYGDGLAVGFGLFDLRR